MKKPKIRPQKWQPPKDAGLVGAFAPNSDLAGLTTIPVPGTGPGDVAISADGWVYTGVADGTVFRMPVNGGPLERVVNTGGRPLGIEVDSQNQLIICDSDMGLLRVDPVGKRIEVLVDRIDGHRPTFVNNSCLAPDGSIYFTDSSTTGSAHHLKADFLEHGRTGRLLRWRPDSGVEVMLENLAFANGVALSHDGEYLLLAETGAHRISKVWLAGPRAGQRETLLDNLPGLPDNITTGTNGVFWVALPSYRSRLLDSLLSKPGWIRSAIWSLPDALQPEASRCTFVLGIDGQGNVVHNLQADGERFHYVTGVREGAGHLWLGSLAEESFARVPWPATVND